MARKAIQILTIIMVLATATIDTATANTTKIPDMTEQWNNQTMLWMSRAWVAESGWGKTDIRKEEQHAIGHALVTLWSQQIRRWPKLRLITVIRGYCAGLGEAARREPTKRQLWIRGLFKEAEPTGWPRSFASWERHIPLWKDTVIRVKKFAHGGISNPCPGASHFGGMRAGDVPRGRMVRHGCSDQFESQIPKGTTFYVVSLKPNSPLLRERNN